MKELTLFARELPTAVMTYSAAIAKSIGFLPNRSAGFPEIRAPITVPINAEDIAKPCWNDDNPNNSCMCFSTPEITAVSKPKRKPPKATMIDQVKTLLFASFFILKNIRT